MKTYFRLLSFAKPFGRFLPGYGVLAILAVVFGLLNFTFIIPLLNILFNDIDTASAPAKPEFALSLVYFKDLFFYHFHAVILSHGKMGGLQFVCAIIVASFFLSNLFKYLSQRILTAMRTHVVRNIRQELFSKISDLQLDFFNNERKGNLMSVLSNDVQEVENSVVSSIQVIFREPLSIIGFFVLLFVISVKLTLFTILVLPLSGLIITRISKSLRKDAIEGQKQLGTIMSLTEEAISGIRIIKGFNAQKFVREKFNVENNKYMRTLKSMVNKRELASPLSEFMGISVVACVLLYGGSLVLSDQSELSGSEFVTYVLLFSQILVPAKNISSALTNIQRGLVAGERILGIVDTPVTIADNASSKTVSAFNKEIEYRNVSFAYTKGDEGWVLKKLNLVIPKGKTIALVGQSGSGKSTMADLLPRFYDSTEGDILLDGVPVRDIKLKDLRALMGIVTQESILFNDTVFNNIAFGMENAKEADVIEAAKIANAHDFIMESPQGYQSNIGDRGAKLSGGQRQRLSIARAVLKNPPLLILDEATSALDTESERLVQDALFKLMKNRTSIVIAHRLSTIQHADEIVVLQKGEIIERGTHTDLLGRNGTYKKLYDLQAFV